MSASLWFYSYVKIRFFNRVRRFLRSKTSRKRCPMPSDPLDISETKISEREESNYDAVAVLQKTVKSLHFGNCDEKQMAAIVMESLAKENVKLRKLMVDLGVIPTLVSMVDSDELAAEKRTPAALKTLIELANDSFENRALMVEERILSKLSNNTHMDSYSHEFAELLLSLSSLANTQLFLTSTEPVISFLLTVLNSESNARTKSSCLSTLFNISTVLENSETLISHGVVPTLLRFSSVKEFSENALPTLGNLVITSKGKKSMESHPKFAEILIEILTWEEKPKCQELSAYIIMVVVHQSWTQRERWAVSGIVPVLLELGLLGSPLGQKRALKLLQWFKDERQARVGPHSGPQVGRVAVGSESNLKEVVRGKKTMRNLVEESLNKNMEMITRRSNGGECSKFRSLVFSESSKSLPY